MKVFGSIARGDARERSDLDLLVDFEERRSLFDLVEFSQRLHELLGISVDVATTNSLRPTLRESILDEAVPL